MMTAYKIVQGRTLPLRWALYEEATGLKPNLAGCTVTISWARIQKAFHGRSFDHPFRADGASAVLVDDALCKVLDQDLYPGEVEWDPGDALVNAPPSDYAVQFLIVWPDTQYRTRYPVDPLVVELLPALGSKGRS